MSADNQAKTRVKAFKRKSSSRNAKFPQHKILLSRAVPRPAVFAGRAN